MDALAHHPVRRPLVATADERLLDQLVEVAAAAGIEVDVVHDVAGLHRRWTGAPLVLLGSDLARRMAHGAATRGGDVVLVSADLDDADVWALAVRAGAERVAILPDARPWLVDKLGGLDESAPRGSVVSVIGGRGGAGASCLAAALATTAQREGRSAVLVDADPLGGGIDLLVGAEDAEGLRWSDLAHASGRLPAWTLYEALPHADGLRLLAWDRGDRLALAGEPVRAVLTSLRQCTELVVVDLPRSFDAATEAVLAHSDTVLIVVPAEVRATAAAARVAASLAGLCADVRVVVRGPAPSGLSPELVATSLGLPLAGWVPAEPSLAEAVERGDPPGAGGRGPLARFCRSFLGGATGVDPAAA
jgi:secretion/DNA translocation related CpaE-like protein